VIESHFLSLVTSETYCHPYFQRNRRHICQFVTRKQRPSKAKDKKTGVKACKKTETGSRSHEVGRMLSDLPSSLLETPNAVLNDIDDSRFRKVETRFQAVHSSLFETRFGQLANDSDRSLEGVEKSLSSGEEIEAPSRWIQHHRTALLESGFEFIGGSLNKSSCSSRSSSSFSADEIIDELISTFQQEQDGLEAV
jgi:hypothetical protein